MRTIFLFLLPLSWALVGCSGSVDHYFSHKEGTPEVAINIHSGEVGSTGLIATDDPRSYTRFEGGRAVDVDSNGDNNGDGIVGNEDDNGGNGNNGGGGNDDPVAQCPPDWTAKTVQPHVILLERNQSSILGQGNAQMDVHGNLLVNSSSSAAIKLVGNSRVSAQQVYMAGFASIAGNALLIADGIHNGMQPVADPLKFVLPPLRGKLATRSDGDWTIEDDLTLAPGLYNGDLHITGNAHVNLLPGVYYFVEGGLKISGNAHVAGSEITFYFFDTNADPMSFSGNGSLSVTPPTKGTLKGITFWVNRDHHGELTLSGNACLNVYGTIYAAGAQVHLTGNADMIAASQIISNSLRVSGNGTSKITYTSPAGIVARPTGCFAN